MKNPFSKSTGLILACAFMLAACIYSCNSISTSTEDNPGRPLTMGLPGITVPTFSSNIPHDVDPATQNALKGNVDSLNVVFNIYSWQAFAAINWPVDSEGNPKPSITSDGLPQWTTWKEYYEVYASDGAAPEPWGSNRDVGALPTELLALPQAAKAADRNVRLLHLTSAAKHADSVNTANEEEQAFTGPVWDQNGNVLYYEILMNQEEFDYVVSNKLYNVNGQVEWLQQHPGQNLNFPRGQYDGDSVGAIEVKLAWKVMTDDDIRDRYFIMRSWVHDSIGTDDQWKEVDLGLVGMHISQKTMTASQWVWSTFEHIDLLDQNTAMVNGSPEQIHPILTDPECEICPVNVLIANEKDMQDYADSFYMPKGKPFSTQGKRMIDIPERVEMVNKAMQAYFASQNSPWQYFRLVDTQYPLDQTVPPSDPNSIPDGVLNKPGGNPNIPFLTNMSMETFFQTGNQPAQNLTEGGSSQIVIFGTESCMGCHSSAGMYETLDQSKTTGQLSADFSWLLLKANVDSSSLTK